MRSSKWQTISLAIAAIALASSAVAEPLVGPSVGNADTLLSEGNRLYNARQYSKASALLLKATRANPASLAAYLSLARSYMAQKQTRSACLAYRAFLRSAPDTADRGRAQSELELCERQLKTRKAAPDPTEKFVATKSKLYDALEKNQLLGPGSAGEALKSLVHAGYLGADLGEMATKVNAAAMSSAEELYKRVLAHEKVPTDQLRKGKQLYQLALDTGTAPPNFAARSAFLEGLASLHAGDLKKAEAHFTEASLADPTAAEPKFYRAMSVYRGGDKQGALRTLETDLPDDPRTAVLRATMALGNSTEAGATELERLLFATRFPAGR